MSSPLLLPVKKSPSQDFVQPRARLSKRALIEGDERPGGKRRRSTTPWQQSYIPEAKEQDYDDSRCNSLPRIGNDNEIARDRPWNQQEETSGDGASRQSYQSYERDESEMSRPYNPRELSIFPSIAETEAPIVDVESMLSMDASRPPDAIFPTARSSAPSPLGTSRGRQHLPCMDTQRDNGSLVQQAYNIAQGNRRSISRTDLSAATAATEDLPYADSRNESGSLDQLANAAMMRYRKYREGSISSANSSTSEVTDGRAVAFERHPPPPLRIGDPGDSSLLQTISKHLQYRLQLRQEQRNTELAAHQSISHAMTLRNPFPTNASNLASTLITHASTQSAIAAPLVVPGLIPTPMLATLATELSPATQQQPMDALSEFQRLLLTANTPRIPISEREIHSSMAFAAPPTSVPTDALSRSDWERLFSRATAPASGSTLLGTPQFSHLLANPLHLPPAHTADLYMGNSDDDVLSDQQILLRQQIEFFQARPDDIYNFSPTRRRDISVGQVGIRCKACALKLQPHRRRKGSVYFPSTLHAIYQAAQNMGKIHFIGNCKCISPHVKARLQKHSEVRAAAGCGGKKYWAKGARKRGIYETELGLRFRSNV